MRSREALERERTPCSSRSMSKSVSSSDGGGDEGHVGALADVGVVGADVDGGDACLVGLNPGGVHQHVGIALGGVRGGILGLGVVDDVGPEACNLVGALCAGEHQDVGGVDDEIDGEEHAVHEAMADVGEDSAAILLADWEVGGDV